MNPPNYLVFLPESDQLPLEYWDLDQKIPLQHCQREVDGKPAILMMVIVPESQLLRFTLPTPNMKRHLWSKAIPYLLEESLSAPVEEYHFVHSDEQAAGTLTILAVHRQTMTNWLTRLANEGVQATKMLGEVDLLPWQQGSWRMIAASDRCWIRIGMLSGFAVDSLNVHQLPSLLPPRDPLMPLLVTDCQSGLDWSAWEQPDLVVEYVKDSAHHFMVQQFTDPVGVDLLQGEFKSAAAMGKWKVWKMLALWILVCWLLALATEQWRVKQLNQQLTAILAEQESLFYQYVPRSEAMTDPQRQLSHLLARQQQSYADLSLLFLLDQTGQALHHARQVRIQNISYHRNGMEIEVYSHEPDQLEAFKKKLRETTHLAEKSASISSDGRNMVLLEMTP